MRFQKIRNPAVATAIGLASGVLCWVFLHRFHLDAGDFKWAYVAAKALLAGADPYANTPFGTVPYPLPAAIVATPLVFFSPEIAAALFFGISSGLLALGLIRQAPARLLILLAYPFWSALLTAQWTPLLMCAAFFPIASATVLAKPNIGAPVALTHISRKALFANAALLLVSLALRPRWPLEWFAQLGAYQYFVPLLVLPGPLLLVALWRYREPGARLLILSAILPQRWFYDSFILWLIPADRRSIVATVGCSWVIGIWRWYHTPHTAHQVGRWSVLGFYLPMLIVVLISGARRNLAITDQQHQS